MIGVQLGERDRMINNPHSPDSELALLGSVMLQPDLIHSVTGLLRNKDFYLPEHRLIFDAMIGLSKQHIDIDPVTLADYLRRRNNLNSVGGVEYIGRLTDDVVTHVNASGLAKSIKALSAQRQMMQAAGKVFSLAQEPQDNIEQFLGSAMQSIVDAASTNTGKEPIHISRGLDEMIATASEGGKNTSRVLTGNAKIDNAISGLPSGVLTVIGGRPGMGKSTVMLNMAGNMARNGAILFFTMEDTARSQQTRVLSRLTDIPYFDIERGNIKQSDVKLMNNVKKTVSKLNIWFDEGPLTADEVCQKALAFQAGHKNTQCIMIDHLGYIQKDGDKNKSPYETISNNTRSFAYLAKRCGLPVVLAVQLNRQLENREDKRPRSSDLRDSGKIEEDARLILMLYRASMYSQVADPRDLDLIVAKNTQGPMTTIPLQCDIKCCKIY